MLSVTRDPVAGVRNNAVRVLAVIAAKHPEIEIPLAPIIQVLNFPDATDRNKASYVIVSLAKKKENINLVKKSAGLILINMLKLQQPNNHDPAYEILQTISGKKFGDRDYQAWENWLAADPTARPADR